MRDLFEPDCYFHVFNHANGDENLFRCRNNYFYFLEKYAEYIQPVAKTFCYCLMPNHFHFLLGIRSEEELVRSAENLTGFGNLSGLVEQPFSNFFNSYAKSFNRKYHRKGSLFNRPYKRKKVSSDDYLTKIIHYIHYNPVHHGFTTGLTVHIRRYCRINLRCCAARQCCNGLVAEKNLSNFISRYRI